MREVVGVKRRVRKFCVFFRNDELLTAPKMKTDAHSSVAGCVTP